MPQSSLTEPVPKAVPGKVVPFVFDITATKFLTEPLSFPESSLHSLLTSRRSEDVFTFLTEDHLSAFLWLGLKAQRRYFDDQNNMKVLRPLPSSGGLNSVEIIVVQPPHVSPEISIYDPIGHSLRALRTSVSCESIRSQVSENLQPQEGTILIFAVDIQKINSRYFNGESLGWRDAGVLIGGLSLVAEALELAFCPLGFTAKEIVAGLLDSDRFFGAGGCIVGGQPSRLRPRSLRYER